MTARLRALAGAVAALTLAGLAAPAASADVAPPPTPVGPDMYFTAAVNPGYAFPGGVPIIKVICPGPVVTGETGHPLSGQYIEAYRLLPPVTASGVGYTGSAADQIDALFTGPSAATVNPPVVIKAFDVEVAIPTTLNLPCGGSGTVSFVPVPTSATARGVAVQVEYANIAF